MATHTTTRVIQLVGRDEHNNAFYDQDLEMIIASCDAPRKQYIVVSVIGVQSSGKSTLMNELFRTDFATMRTRGATTNGIWAGICNRPRAVVLDIEGTDGEEHQNDLGFETRSALFALVVSDIIIFNMWHKDIGLMHGNRLMENIFQERAKKSKTGGLPELHKTTIVFAVRDYDDQEDPHMLERKIFATVDKIWDSIPQREDAKLEKYFTRRVELFPHYRFQRRDFTNKCEDMRERIGNGDFVVATQSDLPVSSFPTYAKGLWKMILENKTLDLPSHKELIAKASCMDIMSKKYQHFLSDEGYQELIKEGKDNTREFDNQLQIILNNILSENDDEAQVYGRDNADKTKGELKEKIAQGYQELIKRGKHNPREFDSQLQIILNNILSEYDDEAQVYGRDNADKMKGELKEKIIQHTERDFISVMQNFCIAISEKIIDELSERCKNDSFHVKRHANSVHSKYETEFTKNTTGLLHSYLVDQNNFQENLKWLCDSFAKGQTNRNLRDLSLLFGSAITSAVLSGAAVVVLGPGALPLMGALYSLLLLWF